ncbi:uncharacterized protein LOC108591008 [Callithrix jacchus]
MPSERRAGLPPSLPPSRTTGGRLHTLAGRGGAARQAAQSRADAARRSAQPARRVRPGLSLPRGRGRRRGSSGPHGAAPPATSTDNTRANRRRASFRVKDHPRADKRVAKRNDVKIFALGLRRAKITSSQPRPHVPGLNKPVCGNTRLPEQISWDSPAETSPSEEACDIRQDKIRRTVTSDSKDVEKLEFS